MYREMGTVCVTTLHQAQFSQLHPRNIAKQLVSIAGRFSSHKKMIKLKCVSMYIKLLVVRMLLSSKKKQTKTGKDL